MHVVATKTTHKQNSLLWHSHHKNIFPFLPSTVCAILHYATVVQSWGCPPRIARCPRRCSRHLSVARWKTKSLTLIQRRLKHVQPVSVPQLPAITGMTRRKTRRKGRRASGVEMSYQHKTGSQIYLMQALFYCML